MTDMNLLQMARHVACCRIFCRASAQDALCNRRICKVCHHDEHLLHARFYSSRRLRLTSEHNSMLDVECCSS